MVKYFIFLLIVATPIWNFNSASGLLNRFEKKVDKELKRIWKGKDIAKDPVFLPDELKDQNRNLFLLKEGETVVGILSLNKARGCQIGGCTAGSKPQQNSGFEQFYYMAVFNPDFTIRKIKVLEYESEYGYEICSKLWLKKFEGFTGCDFEYGKEIDAISGATISGLSIVSDLNNLCWLLREIQEDFTKD